LNFFELGICITLYYKCVAIIALLCNMVAFSLTIHTQVRMPKVIIKVCHIMLGAPFHLGNVLS